MVIRTNSDTPKSYPIPPHIYSIHQSLIQQNIITHPEIIAWGNRRSFLRWIHIVKSSWTMMEEISYWHSLSDITNLIHLSFSRESWINQLDCSEPPEPSPKSYSLPNIVFMFWLNMKSVGVLIMDIRHIAICKSAQQIQCLLMKFNPHLQRNGEELLPKSVLPRMSFHPMRRE